MELYTGKKSDEILDYLLKRRSPAGISTDKPGPSPEELEAILKAASRVPDHGQAVPFYFIVFEGETRKQAGEIFAAEYQKQNPDAVEEKIQTEREKFLYAPVVVTVVHRARKAKHPLWEQMMTCGAVCENLSLAAHASGYGAHWLTGWAAYNETVKKELGLEEGRDTIAGFIHIGAPEGEPKERKRPEIKNIVTHWTPGCSLNQGDEYDKEKFEIPAMGISVS